MSSWKEDGMSNSENPQSKINDFWNTVAPGYDEHAGNVAVRGTAEYAAWTDAIREVLPATPSDVLDIATGTGFVALIIAELGHRVTGVDIAESMIAEARRNAEATGLNATFAIGDAVAPGFPPESFDAVISRHFLWTLREPEAALRNWRALLRPGGRVVAIDGFWFAASSADGPELPGLFEEHYTADTRSALPIMQMRDASPVIALFRDAGFGEVTLRDLTHLPNEDAGGAIPYLIVATEV
jgi:ubiquinone/menaquinone biosynthesis C-methylase UbiE